MKKISGSNFHLKVLFPIFWFGFLGFCLLIGVFDDRASPLLVIISIGFGVFGYVLLKTFIWDLADEVHDAGDYLLFRKAANSNASGSTKSSTSTTGTERRPRESRS